MSRAGLAAAFTNLALTALFGAFAIAHARSFLAHPRASLLFIVVLEASFAMFFLARRDAAETSTSFTAWVSTTAGTFLPFMLRPAECDDALVAQAVQAVGLAFGVLGILSLNRSVGLLPANRGIRRAGAYRFVRHPLYASYLVTHIGYLGSNPTAWNLGVVAATFAAQLIRIRGEERLLSRDPEYASYMASTRWRIVPFVY